MTEQETQKKKPVDFDQMFPGRFLKAGLFLGKTPTFTITSVDIEDLPQDKGGDRTRGILSFRETQLQLVINRTNGECLKGMFGRAAQEWVGKHVTLCTEKDRDPSGGGMVDAIRVLGSPDIEQDMTVEVKLPRRKPKRRTLKKTEMRGKQPPKPQQGPQMVPPDHPMGQAQGPSSAELQRQQYEEQSDPENDGR